MKIQDFPTEILQTVFSKLSRKDYVNDIRFVCRQWYNLAQLETIMLKKVANQIYKELLIDLRKNPLFASSIKKLTLDSEKYLPRDGPEQKIDAFQLPFVYDFNDKKLLPTLIEYCSNLSHLVLCMSCSREISNHLDLIQEMALYNKLKLQALDLCTSSNFKTFAYSTPEESALNQLFSCFNPELLSFTAADYSSRYQGFYRSNDLEDNKELTVDLEIKRRSINFIYKDIGYDNTVFLENLVIKGQYYTISRECLEYLISGKLPHLKFLKIHSTVLESIDGYEDNIWDRLKLGKLLCYTVISLTGRSDQSLHGEGGNSYTTYRDNYYDDHIYYDRYFNDVDYDNDYNDDFDFDDEDYDNRRGTKNPWATYIW